MVACPSPQRSSVFYALCGARHRLGPRQDTTNELVAGKHQAPLPLKPTCLCYRLCSQGKLQAQQLGPAVGGRRGRLGHTFNRKNSEGKEGHCPQTKMSPLRTSVPSEPRLTQATGGSVDRPAGKGHHFPSPGNLPCAKAGPPWPDRLDLEVKSQILKC